VSPLNVLYFVAYTERMAGAQRSLFELVSNLPPRFRPLVVCACEGSVAREYRSAGIPCLVLPVEGEIGRYGRAFERLTPAGLLRGMGGLAAYTVQLRRILREHAIDLVHANDPRGTFLVCPSVRMARIPLIAHLRGEFALGSLARGVFERAPNRIVTVSRGVRKTLSPHGRRKATVIYNGIRPIEAPHVPLPWLEEARNAGRIVVCCFASLVPFKGHHHLVAAVARLRDRGWGADRVMFVVVGDAVAGYEFHHKWLRERIAQLNLDNVRCTGWYDNPYQFYRLADLCVLPSVSRETLRIAGRTLSVRGSEGFPRTHLEAMQFALPVVGTRIAGVAEQVEDGVTGLLVEPSDPEGLADALERLLRDPALRARMGAAGRARVQRLFSTDTYVRRVVQQYDELLAGG
jgi:glycosyltransferase involved in cell wall biosynthesis